MKNEMIESLGERLNKIANAVDFPSNISSNPTETLNFLDEYLALKPDYCESFNKISKYLFKVLGGDK